MKIKNKVKIIKVLIIAIFILIAFIDILLIKRIKILENELSKTDYKCLKYYEKALEILK